MQELRRRIIMPLLLILCLVPMSWAQTSNNNQTPFTLGGLSWEGNLGFVFGQGYTLGKISVVPNVRFALDSTFSSLGVSNEQSVGLDIIAWLMRGNSYRFGVIVNPAKVDWLQFVDLSTGTYMSQSLGVEFIKDFTQTVGVSLWGKGTAQILKARTKFQDRLSGGVAIVIRKPQSE